MEENYPGASAGIPAVLGFPPRGGGGAPGPRINEKVPRKAPLGVPCMAFKALGTLRAGGFRV